ncbi:MAG: CDP-diacylglycerol--serine O-phosphatidyltransferase [Candidatus Anammoxibacter sp.]
MKISKSASTLASLVSLSCGFVCILSAIQGSYDTAAWLIVLSMIFDSLDGKIARFTKTTSAFGGQLDSLVDLVVFGVAPSILVGQFCKDTHPFLVWGTYPFIVWGVSFFFLTCATFRLARFNVGNTGDGKPGKYFTGLPSTISGGTIAQLVLLHSYLNNRYGIGIIVDIIPLVMFILGILMVSRLRFLNIMSKISVRQGIVPFTMEMAGAVILFALNPRLALSISLSAYIIICGLLGLRKNKETEEEPAEQIDVTLSN